MSTDMNRRALVAGAAATMTGGQSGPVVIKLCDYQRLSLMELRAKRDELDQAIKLFELLQRDAGVLARKS
jgi:hypothetical protein